MEQTVVVCQIILVCVPLCVSLGCVNFFKGKSVFQGMEGFGFKLSSIKSPIIIS